MELSLNHFIGNREIERLNRPTAEARGLPGRVYCSEEFFELERRKLFPRRWTAAAFASDIAKPGQVLPVAVAGWELLFVRTSSGKVNCFHNVCRHRGMKLASEARTLPANLSCPWHGWTYDLDGHLVATPNIGGTRVNQAEGFDCRGLDLKPVRCEEWLNFLFVNIDGGAPPLADHLQPLLARCADHDLSLLRRSDLTLEFEFHGNWKLVAEGAVEDYHFPWVHPQLLPQGDFRPEIGGDCYVGISSRPTEKGGRFKYNEPGDGAGHLPKFPHFAAKDVDLEGIFLFIVPTCVFSLNPDHAVTSLFTPIAHDRTHVRRTFSFLGEAATAPAYAEARQRVWNVWDTVGRQDKVNVAAVHGNAWQREALGLETRFSPFWEPAVHHFQKMIVETLRD
ncbi:MAG: aromatic ring-hydroxylating dioxygenase subunit alpha [Proteobacteria bacterium]|nr:aromatic ring-hydroxylating dioxygenase subunit alpha [Pseudomonadota bacterium]